MQDKRAAPRFVTSHRSLYRRILAEEQPGRGSISAALPELLTSRPYSPSERGMRP
jgi:hypothetical protein